MRAVAPRAPTKVEAEALARPEGAAGPRVRLSSRPGARFTPEGVNLGSRGAGPWKAAPFVDLAIAERRDGRVRVVVNVLQEGEAAPRPANAPKSVGTLIPILQTFRLLVWVDEASLDKVLVRDVELRPVDRGSARPKGWDATISARLGTPCSLRETRGDEALIALPFHGGTVSGWVDHTALGVAFEPARAAARGEKQGKRRFVTSGTLHVGKDGLELVGIRHAEAVLRSGGAWSRVDVSDSRAGDITVTAWIRSSELVEPSIGSIGGIVAQLDHELSALDGLDDLPRRSIPKGTLLRDPATGVVVGITTDDAKLAADAEGRLWAPTAWGPVAVLVDAAAPAP
ncbi:MAG: hypothetical protein QM820_26045 [Minicystis sp.]